MSASQDCRGRARRHHRRHHRHPQGDKERERTEPGRNPHVHPVHLPDRDDPGCGGEPERRRQRGCRRGCPSARHGGGAGSRRRVRPVPDRTAGSRSGANVPTREACDSLSRTTCRSSIGSSISRMGNADGSAGPMGTRPRAGVHGSFCSPAAVSRYPGAVVAGSARTRSTRADPAISGVNSSPSCFRYASSVWPPRAAYARTPRLPTSPNGVILGITAVTVMSSPARRDSSWAYPAMNRWVALDPAYPPLAGDPLMAAPLLTTTTLLPGGRGLSRASRSQVNAILTSVCQLPENVSHVWSWSGRITGLAPATRMSTCGLYRSSRLHATVSSAASATSVRMLALVAASSASAGPVRATATTAAPASANAPAIPRPKPRLAPTTTVVLPDKSLIIPLFLCVAMVSVAPRSVRVTRCRIRRGGGARVASCHPRRGPWASGPGSGSSPSGTPPHARWSHRSG